MYSRVSTSPALELSAAPRELAQPSRITNLIQTVPAAIQRAAPAIVARLTLLLIVLYGPKFWEMQVPTVMWAAIGLAWPRATRTTLYWAGFAAIIALGILPRTYSVDNHKMLLVYWALALFAAGTRRDILAKNARLLIGLCFAWATAWKIYNTSFHSGDFMAWELLRDGRFRNFAHLAVGLTSAELDASLAAIKDMQSTGASITLSISDRLRYVALGMTAWTILIEGSIAISFLLAPRFAFLAKIRNWVLITFVATTYPIATVIGFGWILALMGLAQCKRSEKVEACAYVVLFVLMQLYLIPWGDLLTKASLSL